MKPIMQVEADYTAGIYYVLQINLYFVGSPVRDYTVHVYSKQTLSIIDEAQKTSVVHMDGQKPSGFTDQKYFGMDHTIVKPDDPAAPVDPVKPNTPTDPNDGNDTDKTTTDGKDTTTTTTPLADLTAD